MEDVQLQDLLIALGVYAPRCIHIMVYKIQASDSRLLRVYLNYYPKGVLMGYSNSQACYTKGVAHYTEGVQIW